MSNSTPSRPLDSVYDPVYSVSNSGGSFRRGQYRPPSKLPKVVARLRDASVAAASNNTPDGSNYVSGTERHKYFKRPILPHLQAERPEVLLAPSSELRHAQKAHENVGVVADDGDQRTIGIQTMYRESEVQTDPYTPDYTIKNDGGVAEAINSSRMPEIATLQHLKFRQGLPIGPNELELISRNRKKRAFESVLPPMTDEASFLLRKSMLETQELYEWSLREEEIDEVHAERLEKLRQALFERDRENEILAEQRVENLRQQLVYEKENALERIQQDRVTALRKLTKRRQEGKETTVRKDLRREIIQEYADYGSKVYASITRDGKPGPVNKGPQMNREELRDVEEVCALEACIPARMLASAKQKPPKKKIKTVKDRKQADVEGHLLKMEALLQRDNADDTVTEISMDHAARDEDIMSITSPSKRRRSNLSHMSIVRPPTPDYSHSISGVLSSKEEDVESAVRLLQQLIRGRAVQNMMFEAKERRIELIDELRASDDAKAESYAGVVTMFQDEEQPVVDMTLAKIEGEVVSNTLDFLYKELDRTEELARLEEYVSGARDERQRREVLEGSRRQAEELLRQREEAMYIQIAQVHKETGDHYVDDLIEEVLEEDTFTKAWELLRVATDVVGGIVEQLEKEQSSDAQVVEDFIKMTLFPSVQRQSRQTKTKEASRKYSIAVYATLVDMASQMQSENPTS